MNANETKLINYLATLGYKPTKISQNNSYYFTISNILLRISNHLPLGFIDNRVSIVVPEKGKGFSLFINRQLYIIHSLKEMKLFLYHIVILEGEIMIQTRKKVNSKAKAILSNEVNQLNMKIKSLQSSIRKKQKKNEKLNKRLIEAVNNVRVLANEVEKLSKYKNELNTLKKNNNITTKKIIESYEYKRLLEAFNNMREQHDKLISKINQQRNG